MADALFPGTKKSIFVKTYSKVRPHQKFIPDPTPNFKNTSSGTSTVQTGKTLPFILPVTSISPTLVPSNSPSSDTSSSEPADIEVVCNEVETQPSSEEEDEKTFLTLTPRSKNMSKKQSKRKSYSPLKNISNVIKVMHPNKTAPKRVVSPFMWTCTKLRPQGQLACIQESGPESSDDQECTTEANNKPKEISSKRMDNPHKPPLITKKPDTHFIGARAKDIPMSRHRGQDSPMILQGQGIFASGNSSIVDNQRSTQSYESHGDQDELSTVTYTRQSGETSDDSTHVASDTGKEDQDSTMTDTLNDEAFSEIEIPRDFPGPTARMMKQLTPKIAQLVLPEVSSDRKTLRKSGTSTVKAMPKKVSSTWHNRKPVIKAKNSTLLEGLSALNIQEYGLTEEISSIKEENSKLDLDSKKITSTPASEGRNVMLHQRFIPDVSSIEGDACALPTIDVMQSLNPTTLADNMKSSTRYKSGLRPVSSADTKGSAFRSVYSVSASSDGSNTPLSIRGRKVFTTERMSPKMSTRVQFRQYPKVASKTTPSSLTNMSVVSAGNSSCSSNKHVKFLLSNKSHEVLPEPDYNMSLSIVNLPELPPSSSILKKKDKMHGEFVSSVVSKTEDLKKHSSKQQKQPGRQRMTSTPQRQSRRIKGGHMLELSFDVSSVDLPSCSDDDLIIQPSNPTESQTAAIVTNYNSEESTITPAGQNTQELIDFEPIPMQASTCITMKPLHSGQVAQEEKTVNPPQSRYLDNATEPPVCATTDNLATQNMIHATEVQGHLQEVHPTAPTQNQNEFLAAEHSIGADIDRYCHLLEEVHQVVTKHPDDGTHGLASSKETQLSGHGTSDHLSPQVTQHPVDGTNSQISGSEMQHLIHATPRTQLKRSSPNGDLPGRPTKKKFHKEIPDIVKSSPQTCDRATQKDLPKKQKMLEYVDKAVGLPECIFSRLGPTPFRPARFRQYVDTVGLIDYEKMKKLPQDIIETVPDALFS